MCNQFGLKIFPDGLMDNMALKLFQVVLCPTELFQ